MKKFEEIIKLLAKMVFSYKFLGAVVASIVAYTSGNIEGMVAVIVAYLAIKSFINASITFKEGEFEYPFVSDGKINSVICWVFSTKTWISIFGVSMLMKAACVALAMPEFLKFTFVATEGTALITFKEMTDYLVVIGIALGGAIGLPEVAGFLKGVDLSKYKPIPKPVLSPKPIIEAAPVLAIPSPNTATNPYPNRPPLTPFNNAIWDSMFESYMEAHPQLDIDAGRNDASNIATVSIGQTVWYPELLVDFANWRMSKYYAEFEKDFGFKYQDSEKHWGDKGLVGSCAATSEGTFVLKLPRKLKDIYNEMRQEEARYENFAISYNNMSKEYIELVLATGKYSYMAAYFQLWSEPQHFV